MIRQLRRGTGKTGLVLANGGVVTYQHVVCLSRSPRRDGLPYPNVNPLPATLEDVQSPPVDERAEGEAIIEVSTFRLYQYLHFANHCKIIQTYTVSFDRAGKASRGFIVGRMRSNGHRFVANDADQKTLLELCNTDIEPVGRSGRVRTLDTGRNVFALDMTVPRL
jgi:hypothetical protein